MFNSSYVAILKVLCVRRRTCGLTEGLLAEGPPPSMMHTVAVGDCKAEGDDNTTKIADPVKGPMRP